MKRILLVTALMLSGALAAHADTSKWTSKPPRSDYELHTAGNYCDAQVGPDRNGVPTSAAYKKCMARQGWTYSGTVRDDTWINHHGMRCHPILNGFGSECDSIW